MDHRGDQVFLTACLLYISIVLHAPASAQVCQVIGVVTQDSQLTTGDLTTCKTYPGDLTIGVSDCSQTCRVTSIPALQLSTIQGSLKINCCPNLITIGGFNLLTSVRSIDIYYNANLTSITAFAGIPQLQGYLTVAQNPKLVSITGLSELEVIGSYLEIDRNPSLTDVNLSQLMTIRGTDTVAGNALSISYNTALQTLSGFGALSGISYGTVRIEGNTALCYAGYPQWGVVGQFASRDSSSGADKGVDWRPLLSASNQWQYTWGVEGGGIPTLLIRDNAPAGSCESASCSPICDLNAGCLGPVSGALCGSCTILAGGVNPCNIIPPAPSSVDSTLIIVGVVVGIIAIALLVLVPLGIWGCVVVGRRYHALRQGSFDISTNSVEDGFSLRSNSRGSQQIATVAEPTTGSSVTRKGVKYTPKLDSVVILSNKMNETSTDFDTPSSSYGGQSSAAAELEVPPALPPPRQSRSSKRSLESRPKSESSPLDRAPQKRSSSSSLMEGSASQEPGTEDILKRLREERVEVPMDFPWDSIKLGKELGTGDFGKVLHAEARKLLPGQKKTAVMVKQLKEGATTEERDTFLRPVEAMKVLQHSNVLSLLGVSMKGRAIYVLLEYCSQGNFKTFLVRKRRESMAIKQSNQLISMAIDMAAGLEYLHSMNIAHNDFAARSCLVTSEGQVKLGDYGITRQTFKEDYYARKPSQKALPIRWMPPELIVIKDRNTLNSLPVSMTGNIWSFGVALWEVSSFAQWPYDDLSNEEVLQTLKTTGKCILENPLRDTDHIAPLFDICQSCWQPAELRPSMTELHGQLKELTNPSYTRRSTTPTRPTSQNRAATMRPKSQSFLPTAPREEATNDDTLKRTSQYKPRRSAPTKPAPSRPAPGRPNKNTSTFPRSIKGRSGSSQEEPLVISNTASLDEPKVSGGKKLAKKDQMYKKKTESTEALLTESLSPNDRGTTKTTPKSRSISRHDPLVAKKKTATKTTETADKRVNRSTHSTAPDRNNREMPPLKEMNQDDQAMAEDDYDFILDPPQTFSQDDDLEEEPQNATGGAPHFRDVSDTEEPQMRGVPPSDDRRWSNIERKIHGKKSGNKILSRTKTPASLEPPDDDDYDYVDDIQPNQPGDDDYDDVIIQPNQPWQNDDEEYPFDEYDEPEAMEEPNTVYDEEVAALIW